MSTNPVLTMVFGVHRTATKTVAEAKADGSALSFFADALPYAQQAHAATDVDTSVILAQWADEQGYDWPPLYNNPGNVGDPYAAGQQSYATVEAGVEAYISTMLLGYYVSVREAVGADAQCYALGQSPWAGGQYMANGVPGEVLVELINEFNLTQYDGPTPTPTPTPPVPAPPQWLVKEVAGKFGNLNAPIVAGLATATGNGYTLVGADGGTFNYGDAKFFGSLADIKLNAPIVDAKLTPSDGGIYLVGTDGGVFCFGNAAFHGSTGSMKLNAPIVSITLTSAGYRLVGADGGVFCFGNASFKGSPA